MFLRLVEIPRALFALVLTDMPPRLIRTHQPAPHADTVLIPSAPAAPAKKAGNDLATLEVQKAGATMPFGYFDPLGLSKGKSIKELKKWRESELKHGRVAMLAAVGVLVQERFSPFYNPESGSTDPGPALFHFQEIEALNPFLFIFLILGTCVLTCVRGRSFP